jgi:hypothetical protein
MPEKSVLPHYVLTGSKLGDWISGAYNFAITVNMGALTAAIAYRGTGQLQSPTIACIAALGLLIFYIWNSFALNVLYGQLMAASRLILQGLQADGVEITKEHRAIFLIPNRWEQLYGWAFNIFVLVSVVYLLGGDPLLAMATDFFN